MKTFFTFIVISALLTGTTRGRAEKDQTGSVFGYIYNASLTGGESSDPKGTIKQAGLAGQEVVLHKYVDGKADDRPRARTVTDSDGRFEFAGLDIGQRYGYYPVTRMAGLEYYGPIVKLETESPRSRSDVAVFESTGSDSSISVPMHHIIITPTAGMLNVKEVVMFANSGRMTYVGSAPAGPPNSKIVLQLDVPEGAQELQVGGDLMKCCAVVTEDGIYDTMEFKPGSRNEAVTYRLPYNGQTATLVKKVRHPTMAFDVFLPENSGMLTAPEFTLEGGFQIRGQTFQRFSTVNAEVGKVLTLTFSGLPETPADWRWLPPAALVILIVAGAWFFGRRQHARSPDSTPGSARPDGVTNNSVKERLLDAILDLDDRFEAGNMDEAAYLAERDGLQAQVMALEGPGKGGGLVEANSNPEETDNESR